MERFTPPPFTALGWEVADVTDVLARLASEGVIAERYAWLDQDAAGIWCTPTGARVAFVSEGPISAPIPYEVGPVAVRDERFAYCDLRDVVA